MTRHGQVARTTAPRRRRSTGCYVHIAVAPVVTHTNPVGIQRYRLCDLARKPLPRPAHRTPCGSSRQALAHPEAQIPIGNRLRPAGSCMRDFRTPDGTRNPSACQSSRLTTWRSSCCLRGGFSDRTSSIVSAGPHTVGRHSGSPRTACVRSSGRGFGGGPILLPLLAFFCDGFAGRVLEENRKRFLCLPLVSQTSVDPRKHSVCAARDFGHFPHRRQRSPAIVLFLERPAHLPVEPVRVERIDAHGLLDPIDRFVGAANKEQRGRTADEDIRVAGIQGDRLIEPRKGLLDLSGFGMDAGADMMRLGIVRSEQDGLVGVFGGALQRLVAVVFLLVPPNTASLR